MRRTRRSSTKWPRNLSPSDNTDNRSNFAKKYLKRVMRLWNKRTVSNAPQRKLSRIARNLASRYLLERVMRRGLQAASRLREMKLAAGQIRAHRTRALVAEYFDIIRKKCERKRRYEVEKGTALFKYSQKLERQSFDAVRSFAQKAVLSQAFI